MRPLALVGLFLAGCAHVTAAPAVPNTTRAHAFASRNNTEHLVVASFGAPGPACVLRFEGTKTVFDGLALPCTADFPSMQLWVVWMGQTYRVHAARGSSPALPGLDGRYFGHDLTPAPDPTPAQLTDLYRTWETQRDDGRLAAFARFDVATFRKRAEFDLTSATRRDLSSVQVTDLPVTIDWTGATEQQSPADGCFAAVTALRRTLETLSAPASALLRSRVKAVRCVLGASSTVTLVDGTLTTTIGDPVPSTDELAALTDAAVLDSGANPAVANEGPWARGGSVRQLDAAGALDVCQDDRGRVVAVGRGTWFGVKPTELTRSNTFGFSSFETGLDFIDPRFVVSPNGSGPYRHAITPRLEADRCELSCGARTVKLRRLSKDEGVKLLLATQVRAGKFVRQPHALLRDDAGTYYFVDVGSERGRERDFRLLIGQRGRLKVTRLLNVVNDSEGEVFATANGELRLTVDKRGGAWSKRGKVKPLRLVPPLENLELIYGSLGVYDAARLDTPCDEF